MKRILFYLSLVLFAAWLVSFLALNFTPLVHVLLLVSVLLYMRSVMVVEEGKSESTDTFTF